jgi:hypothetical protein
MALLVTSSGAECYKSTQMMTSANTEDPWIDSSIVPRLGATRLHPSVDFFKTEAESRLTLSQSLQLNLRLGGYSIWSVISQSHFHIISTSRQMSWTTFQPRGSSSTIEDFSKQYSRMLKNYSRRLQDYSNYYSRLQRARGLVGHTPRVLMKGRKKTNSY